MLSQHPISKPNFTARHFAASVTYPNATGRPEEEEFPVLAPSYQEANRIALAYVLQVLRLDEFELRVVGS